MSGSKIFKSTMLKSSMIIGTSVVALTLGACASSGANGSRYGNVYDYESGSGSCNTGASCGAVITPPVESRYGSSTTVIGGQAVSPGVVYTDCSQTAMGCGAPAPRPSVQYSPPSMRQAPTAAYSSPPSMSYSGEAVSCPSGTTAAGDGTCMMSGSGSYTGSSSTYSSGSTYSGSGSSSAYTGSSSAYTGSSSSYGEPVSCPSGTTKANDGTCMMSGSGSYTGSSSTYNSGSTYSGSSSTYNSGSTYSGSSSASGGTADCPSGTSRANDGTCMMSSGSSLGSSNVTIYPTTGYQAPVDYTAPIYEPIRK